MPFTRREYDPIPRPDHQLMLDHLPTGKPSWARREAEHSWIPQSSFAQFDREITHIYRVTGRHTAPEQHRSVVRPPFRAPHHTISPEMLRGSFRDGWRWTPGELSLAHGGVLFLDGIHEFNAHTLDTIRVTMQTRVIHYGNVDGPAYEVPCIFRLLVGGTLCPCGHHGAALKRCMCSAESVKRHQARIPLWIRENCKLVHAPNCAPGALNAE